MQKIPFSAAQSEFTEKRSRFIGQVWPVSSEEEAQERIRADVTITVSLPQGGFEGLQQRLTELSAGAITLESLGQGLRPGPREDI